ncbi:hypothetical protein IWQ61_001738 [Dispira simplex]|nr:hypothetical protein IWQ61_001738 [Dispira simplex]
MSTFHFCSECNNLLYPREDRESRVLFYECRNCDHSETAKDSCVFRHVITHVPSEQTMVIANLSSDPTLPRTNRVPCPKCSHNEAVFFQTQSRSAQSKMTLYYVCCNPNCSHRWTSA